MNKSFDELKQKAISEVNNLMGQENYQNDDVHKELGTFILAPNNHNFVAGTVKKILNGVDLDVSDLRAGLTGFGRELLLRAENLLIALPNDSMICIKVRWHKYIFGKTYFFPTQEKFPNLKNNLK